MIENAKYWHHQIDFGDNIVSPGALNSKILLSYLKFPKSFKDKRVLDIGASDGFFSFDAEKRGAKEVIAIDYEPPKYKGVSVAKKILNSHVKL